MVEAVQPRFHLARSLRNAQKQHFVVAVAVEILNDNVGGFGALVWSHQGKWKLMLPQQALVRVEHRERVCVNAPVGGLPGTGGE
jgi:hypothetical protein